MACTDDQQHNARNEAINIYNRLRSDSMARYLAKNSVEPVQGFYSNESYTMLNLYPELIKLKRRVKIAGIFGDEDGLFDTAELGKIKKNLGSDNFFLITSASHAVFIDQQSDFLKALIKIIRN